MKKLRKLSSCMVWFRYVCYVAGLVLMVRGLIHQIAAHNPFWILVLTIALAELIVMGIMDFASSHRKEFKSFCDFLWVLKAFLYGKIFRQKGYRPLDNAFRLPASTNAKRIMMLARWWGYRSATFVELISFIMEHEHGENKPFDSEQRLIIVRDRDGKFSIYNVFWDENDGWDIGSKFPMDRRRWCNSQFQFLN